MLDVFFEVIVPVLAVAVIGGWIADRVGMPVKPLSQLSFYFLSPALVFDSLSQLDLSGEATARLALVGVAGWLVVAAVSIMTSVVLRHDTPTRAAVAIVAVMGNGGNMGLPVALLAFGDEGLEIAILLFVVSILTANTGGIVLASMAGGADMRKAWRAPLAVPSIWAAAAGLTLNYADLSLPDAAETTISTVGASSIPVMLIVLGLHIRRPVKTETPVDLAAAVVLRLGGGPLAAWLATLALDVDGVAQKTAIVIGGMPTAVMATIFATQYDARPAFVTRVVIVSTMVSVASLTILVGLLR